MSASFSCKCSERKLPIENRAWFVLVRNCNFSAFNGYRRTYSDYSTVRCEACQTVGRTKAGYVAFLDDADESQGHAATYYCAWPEFDPEKFDAEMGDFLADLLARGKGLNGSSAYGAMRFHEMTIKEKFAPRTDGCEHVEMQYATAWIRQHPNLFNGYVREFVNSAHSMGWHVRTKSRAGAIRFIAAADPSVFSYVPGNQNVD